MEPSFEAFLDLLHPQDRPVAIQRSRDIHAGLDMTAHDMRLIRPDGKLIWIHSRSRATRDASGNIVSIEGTDQDITERKLAEQALRESEERYRNFVEHTLDGLMIHAFDGSILDVNSQACQMLGYTRGELIGQTPFFFDCDLNQDRFSDLMQQLWDGNCVIFESRHRRKDGKLFPVEVRLRPIPFHGRPAALALIRNMSHSREAAWHREDRDRLWNHSPDMLLVADAAGVIKQINPAWRKLLGWELEQLFGQPLLELVHDEEKAVVADYLKQVVQSEPTKTGRRARPQWLFGYVLAMAVSVVSHGTPSMWPTKRCCMVSRATSPSRRGWKSSIASRIRWKPSGNWQVVSRMTSITC